LNDSTCFKIARNKNLCSEILTVNNIPNVPHKLLLSPTILKKRKSKQGNSRIIGDFIGTYGFPLLIKKNNSSKGKGVYLVKSEPELEETLSKVYMSEMSLCLSPFRRNIREFRNVVMDGNCVLSYEKKIAFVEGNGISSVIELLSSYSKDHALTGLQTSKLFDKSLVERFSEVPQPGECVFLQWKHNRYAGTTYEVTDNEHLKALAVKAAHAINGRFVSVDIIQSEEFGFEVLEINSTVGIHFPIIYPGSEKTYEGELDIYITALQKVFE